MPDEQTNPAPTPEQAAPDAPEQTGDGSSADQASQQHGNEDNVQGGDVVHGDKIVQAPSGGSEIDNEFPDDDFPDEAWDEEDSAS